MCKLGSFAFFSLPCSSRLQPSYSSSTYTSRLKQAVLDRPSRRVYTRTRTRVFQHACLSQLRSFCIVFQSPTRENCNRVFFHPRSALSTRKGHDEKKRQRGRKINQPLFRLLSFFFLLVNYIYRLVSFTINFYVRIKQGESSRVRIRVRNSDEFVSSNFLIPLFKNSFICIKSQPFMLFFGHRVP